MSAYEDPPSNPSDVKVYRHKISNNLYYLLVNIQRKLSNVNLPASGLQLWLINQTVVAKGLRNNRVNTDFNNLGVALIEADGKQQLRSSKFAGGSGDLFPGSAGVTAFDNNSSSKSIGSFALCDIKESAGTISTNTLVSNGTCPGQATNPIHRGPTPNTPTSNTPGANNDISVADISARANEFIGKQISLSGVIENMGTNLQMHSTRHLVLTDNEGRHIDVRVAYPTEVTRPQPGDRNDTLSLPQVLDQNVQVTGTVERNVDGSPRLVIQHINRIKVP
jgi:hypothetical protein